MPRASRPPRPLPDPPAELVITDVEQLKAVSDPLRLELLDLMTDEASLGWTAKELAERLATKQTKLYHHLALLEERGFIRVAATRMVSGIQERRYQVTARSFRVERSLLTGGDSTAAMSGALDALFEKARIDIVAGLQSGAIDLDPQNPKRHRMGVWATHARLSPASVRRVMRLVEKLAEVDEHPDPDGAEYGLIVGFYPRASKETDR
jgi:DNA-binding transcriptional ArsR family regulator